MPLYAIILVSAAIGGIVSYLLTSWTINRIKTKGSVIFEYSFGWIPETATLPQTVSHAQELNLSKSNHIALDHKPITPVRVTVRDTQCNTLVEFYVE